MRRILPVVVLLLVLFAGGLYFFFRPAGAVPQQPIAFSHKNHAVDRQIQCIYCHRGADDGFVAGVPPLETCMGCHRSVGTSRPEVQVLLGYWERQEPVQWAKVTYLPDHVSFAHKPHIRANIVCVDCHAQGAVGSPERWFETFAPGMAWCTTCHSQRGVSTQCYTCHK